jgi:hypothetical protein
MSLGRCCCCGRRYRSEKARQAAERYKAVHDDLRATKDGMWTIIQNLYDVEISRPLTRQERHRAESQQFRQQSAL